MPKRLSRAYARSVSACALIYSAALLISTASYADEAKVRFNIPPENTARALNDFSSQSDIQILFPYDTAAQTSAPAISGDLLPRDALTRILANTNLEIATNDGKTIALRTTQKSESAAAVESTTEVIVTGTRIRGRRPASPVIVLGAEDMKNAGQSDLGEAIRALPQNFGGGQNPGVGFTQGAGSNFNVNGASKANLRGLGPDATLTLLNGHRLADDSAFAGVDITSIPTAAVDRVEIVADGSSALYGSDAVGGVINVILRKDFDGVVSSARAGASTDGGNDQYQVGVVLGKTWADGGMIATADYTHTDAIRAADRSYTSSLNPINMLSPDLVQRNFTLSGHQSLAENLAFSFDALFSLRDMYQVYADTADAPPAYSGQLNRSHTNAYAVAPKLEWGLSNGWRLSVSAVASEDRAENSGTQYYMAYEYPSALCYCDKASSVQVDGEGALFRLPAGLARLAVGAGYRTNTMHLTRTFLGADDGHFDVTRRSTYGFGELFLPLVAKFQSVPLVRSLSVTAALRTESYADLETVTTPKLGLVYEPGPDFDISASWGKSFKAPNFLEQYADQSTVLRRVTGYGTTFPADATYIGLSGGNADLKPERATSWTATLNIHPRAVAGLKGGISYFHIDYRDRIAVPLVSTVGVLTNPVYSQLVTLDPTQAQIEAAMDGAAQGLIVVAPAVYDPATVAAIVDNRYQNTARQRVEGIDVNALYGWAFSGSSLSVSGSATYLRSQRQLSGGEANITLAGTIFNVPRLKGRAGLTWQGDTLSLSSFATYVGDVRDTRIPDAPIVEGMTTLDLISRKAFTVSGKPGFDVSLEALNIFNAKPQMIYTSYSGDTPYDTTNYSSVGRYVGLTVSKTW